MLKILKQYISRGKGTRKGTLGYLKPNAKKRKASVLISPANLFARDIDPSKKRMKYEN